MFEDESRMRSSSLGGSAAVHYSAARVWPRKLYISATQRAACEYRDDIEMFTAPHVERSVEASDRAKPSSNRASSQENIMKGAAAVAVMETVAAASDP